MFGDSLIVSRTSSVRHHYDTKHTVVAELDEDEKKKLLEEKSRNITPSLDLLVL
jgi:hypothetical protein